MTFQQEVKLEAGHVTASNLNEKLDLLQTSKSIEELCIRGGLSYYESQNKVICDICFHEDLTGNDVIRKLGEFGYDSFRCGVDFTNKSEPREFRNLKSVLIKHFGSQYHMKMGKDLSEKHISDEKNEIYNTKIGMGRAR